MRIIKLNEAINETLDIALKTDSSIIIMGLGSDDPKRIFKTTNNLIEKYGKNRVFDVPTSENAMMGVAIGASINKLRPIISHQRVEFSLLAFEQIINQAAKWSYMTAGKMNVPLVIRLIIGRGWGQGTQHSQSLESVYSHIPGIKVVSPSNAYDAKGLLLSSIKDNNPVIFFEHRWLHESTAHVPKKKYYIRLGKAKKLSSGKNITIVTFSYMCLEVLKILGTLKKYKITVDLIDLRTIKPIDSNMIINSVKKTRRLIVVDNGWPNFGVSAEIITLVTEKIGKILKSNCVRVGINNSPIPSTRALAKYCYPDANTILKTIGKLFKIKINKKDFLYVKLDETDVPDKSFLGPF